MDKGEWNASIRSSGLAAEIIVDMTAEALGIPLSRDLKAYQKINGIRERLQSLSSEGFELYVSLADQMRNSRNAASHGTGFTAATAGVHARLEFDKLQRVAECLKLVAKSGFSAKRE